MKLHLFCDEFILSEYLRLKLILDGMPRYKAGTHKGVNVIREYSGRGGNITTRISHAGSRNYAAMQKRLWYYEDCKLKKSLFYDEIRRRRLAIPEGFKFVRKPSTFNANTWKQYEACSNPIEIDTDYYDDYGFNVRSRGEMMVGNALKELGLDAKYEPQVKLKNGRKKTPDYSFPVPVIDRCFYVEFVGKTDNEEYIRNNYGKIDEYMLNGILPGRDLILICGTENWIPTQETIMEMIASFINIAVRSVYNKKLWKQ